MDMKSRIEVNEPVACFRMKYFVLTAAYLKFAVLTMCVY